MLGSWLSRFLPILQLTCAISSVYIANVLPLRYDTEAASVDCRTIREACDRTLHKSDGDEGGEELRKYKDSRITFLLLFH